MKARHSLTLTSVMLLIASLSSPAHAGFRCAMNKVVSEGESTSTVLIACGEPLGKRKLSSPGADLLVEEWTYKDYQDSRWVKILRFEDGTLVKIDQYRP
jgi:hypothetical protein